MFLKELPIGSEVYFKGSTDPWLIVDIDNASYIGDTEGLDSCVTLFRKYCLPEQRQMHTSSQAWVWPTRSLNIWLNGEYLYNTEYFAPYLNSEIIIPVNWKYATTSRKIALDYKTVSLLSLTEYCGLSSYNLYDGTRWKYFTFKASGDGNLASNIQGRGTLENGTAVSYWIRGHVNDQSDYAKQMGTNGGTWNYGNSNRYGYVRPCLNISGRAKVNSENMIISSFNYSLALDSEGFKFFKNNQWNLL